MPEQLSQQEIDVLLKEYEVCESSVESFAVSVWQTSTVIGIAGIAPLALVAANNAPLGASCIAGLSSILGILVWWRIAIRLWSVRDVKLKRMFHIEEDLGIGRQGHYVRFMDDLHDKHPSRKVSTEDAPEIKALSEKSLIPEERAKKMAAEIEYERKGPKDATRIFIIATIILWLLYVVYRVGVLSWSFASVKLILFPILIR